jgi:hypothetical protein
VSETFEKHLTIRCFTCAYEAACWLLWVFRICSSSMGTAHHGCDDDCTDDEVIDGAGNDDGDDADDDDANELRMRLAEILSWYVVDLAAPPDDAMFDLTGAVDSLAEFWWIDVEEMPTGPFPDVEATHLGGARPAANTGADFVYMALRSIGRVFSDTAFRRAFEAFRQRMRDDGWIEEEEEDEGG